MKASPRQGAETFRIGARRSRAARAPLARRYYAATMRLPCCALCGSGSHSKADPSSAASRPALCFSPPSLPSPSSSSSLFASVSPSHLSRVHRPRSLCASPLGSECAPSPVRIHPAPDPLRPGVDSAAAVTLPARRPLYTLKPSGSFDNANSDQRVKCVYVKND